MSNIQKIRKERGFTQAELAKKAGISEISVRKYESGERRPKIETLSKIAIALNIPVADLFEGDPRDFAVPPGKIQLGDGENAILVDPIEFQKVFNRIVQRSCPNPVSILLEEFYKLSPTGQDMAIKQTKLLTKIPEYQKKD